MEVSDSEVINIMVDGGHRVCDHAQRQWIADKYNLGEEVRRENIQRWKAIRKRITELGRLLKETSNE